MPERKLSPNHSARFSVKAKGHIESRAAQQGGQHQPDRTEPRRHRRDAMRRTDHADAPHCLDQADGDIVDATMLERERDQRQGCARLHAVAQQVR
jgi:hypothetical protein